MSTISLVYQSQLHTEATHNASQNKLTTDAPIDNGGKGETFSPTDLLATALGACELTIIGQKATSLDIELTDMRAEVTKIMVANPRRVGALEVDIYINHDLPEDIRKRLEAAGNACPVAKSLNTDIVITHRYHYPTK